MLRAEDATATYKVEPRSGACCVLVAPPVIPCKPPLDDDETTSPLLFKHALQLCPPPNQSRIPLQIPFGRCSLSRCAVPPFSHEVRQLMQQRHQPSADPHRHQRGAPVRPGRLTSFAPAIACSFLKFQLYSTFAGSSKIALQRMPLMSASAPHHVRLPRLSCRGRLVLCYLPPLQLPLAEAMPFHSHFFPTLPGQCATNRGARASRLPTTCQGSRWVASGSGHAINGW